MTRLDTTTYAKFRELERRLRALGATVLGWQSL